MGYYVGDMTPHAENCRNRPRRAGPAKGWNVKVKCGYFFIFIFVYNCLFSVRRDAAELPNFCKPFFTILTKLRHWKCEYRSFSLPVFYSDYRNLFVSFNSQNKRCKIAAVVCQLSSTVLTLVPLWLFMKPWHVMWAGHSRWPEYLKGAEQQRG